MVPVPDDDRPHESGVGRWLETWGFAFSGGGVRLTRTAAGTCWWWTYLESAETGIVIVRDDDVPAPRRADSLEIRADGLWAELVCETPFEHWGIALEAFGLRVDTPDDDIGERLPVGLDLEWELSGPPELDGDDDGHRVSQPGRLHGELLLVDARVPIDAPCTRDHAWGQIPSPIWPPRLAD